MLARIVAFGGVAGSSNALCAVKRDDLLASECNTDLDAPWVLSAVPLDAHLAGFDRHANMVAATSDSALKTQAQKLVGALAPGGYVLAEGHLGPKVEGCGGVSLYLPSPTSSTVSKHYKDLSFAKRHRWDEFLADYCRAVRS